MKLRITRATFASALLAITMCASASSAGADDSTRMSPARATWFQAAVPCITGPGSCPAANPYPEGTLHVAVSAGSPTAAAAVEFATTSDHSVGRATLTIPINGAPGDGGVRPETAHFGVCPLDQPFTGPPGQTSSPPPCSAPPVAASLDAAASSFVVDATALVRRAVDAGSPTSLLLIATPIDPAETWHVAFAGPGYADAAAKTITLDVAPDADATPPEGAIGIGGSFIPPTAGGLGFAGGTLPVEPPVIVQDASHRRPAAAATLPRTLRWHYAYAIAWTLPLLLLVGAGAIGGVLIRDMRPRRPLGLHR